MTSVLKIAFLIALLVCIAAIGIGCLINPDWGIRNLGSAYLRGGGKLKREWSRIGVQIMGALMTGFAIYLVFHLIHD